MTGGSSMRRLVVLTIASGLIAGSLLQAEDTAPAKKGTWFPTFKSAAKADDSQKNKAKDAKDKEALDEIEIANAERTARRKKSPDRSTGKNRTIFVVWKCAIG